MRKTVKVSFRCYFPEGNHCRHWQDLTWEQIPQWVTVYLFTHPNCTGVSVLVTIEGAEK